MMTNKTPVRRLPWALLVGISVLLPTAGLSLLLPHFQVLAQPEVEAAAASLEVQKEVNTTQARPGDTLTYTITISNVGDTQTNAWLTDTLPTGELTYTTDSLTATAGSFGIEAGGVITWTGPLTSSEVATVTFAAQIASPPGDQTRFDVINTAEVTGAGTLMSDSVETTTVITFETRLPCISYNYPPRPTLNYIPSPGADNSYTASWQFISVPIDQYVLQESTSADFDLVTRQWQTTATSQLVQQGSYYGTLYYRVRADKDGHWGEGPWSNIESVANGLSDDFSDPSSGWPRDSGPMKDTQGAIRGYWHRRYSDSSYQIYIEHAGGYTWDWFYQPDALAPYTPSSDKYCVETNVQFVQHGWWANAGLVFGANDANTDIYALCLSSGGKHLDWFVMRSEEYHFPKGGCSAPSYKVGSGSQGTSWNGWNHLQVSVDGYDIDVYVGGIHVGSWTMSGLKGNRGVGVIGGSYEVTPIDIRFDDFRVMLNTACTPTP